MKCGMRWNRGVEVGWGGGYLHFLFIPHLPLVPTRALPQPSTPALSRKFEWEAGKQAVRKFSLWSIFWRLWLSMERSRDDTCIHVGKGSNKCALERATSKKTNNRTWRHMIDSDAQMLVLHSCSNALRSNDFSAGWLRSTISKRQGKMIPCMYSKSTPPSLNCLILETHWVG